MTAIQVISIGSTPNDGTGDVERICWQKVNANFASLSNAVLSNSTATTSVGYQATPDSIGTISSGAITPLQSNGDYHTIINNGAFKLNPPVLTSPGTCASGVLEVYNNSAAGNIDTTGWTKVNGAFDTVSGYWYQCDYCITPRGSYLNIRAMQ